MLKNRAGLTIHSGKRPTSLSLNTLSGFFKGETDTLILNKKDYEEKTVTINSTLDGWYVGNIVFGGIIGLLIVDPAPGEGRDYEPFTSQK